MKLNEITVNEERMTFAPHRRKHESRTRAHVARRAGVNEGCGVGRGTGQQEETVQRSAGNPQVESCLYGHPDEVGLSPKLERFYPNIKRIHVTPTLATFGEPRFGWAS